MKTRYALAALLSVSMTCGAQTPGMLDPQFGLQAGYTHIGVAGENTTGTSLASMPQGDYVVSGMARPTATAARVPLLAKTDARGQPDTAFGENGVLTGPVVSSTLRGHSEVLADAQRIYQVFQDPQHFYVAAYRHDGQPDTTYGNGGIAVATLDITSNARFQAVLQSGRVLIASGGGLDGAAAGMMLIRFTPQGTLDPQFRGGGIALYSLQEKLPFEQTFHRFFGLTLQPDGKILATGGLANAELHGDYLFSDALLARFNADGQPDASFASGGFKRIDLLDDDFGTRVVARSDGKMMMAGTGCRADIAQGNERCYAVVMQLLADGRRDPSYGDDGVSLQDVATVIDAAGNAIASPLDLAIDPQGRALVVGTARSDASEGFTLRLLPDGTRDSAFGFGGVAYPDRDIVSQPSAVRLVGNTADGRLRLVSVGTRAAGLGGSDLSAMVLARQFAH